MAALYVTGVDARWPEEALSPLKTIFRNCRLRYGACQDAGHVDRRTTQTARLPDRSVLGNILHFTETYGHILPRDAGDIDLRDSIHSDRILITMIPALELSRIPHPRWGKSW